MTKTTNGPVQTKYKTEVLGRWLRIVDEDGNDVIGIGDCHEPGAHELASFLAAQLNQPTPVITVKDVIKIAAKLGGLRRLPGTCIHGNKIVGGGQCSWCASMLGKS